MSLLQMSESVRFAYGAPASNDDDSVRGFEFNMQWVEGACMYSMILIVPFAHFAAPTVTPRNITTPDQVEFPVSHINWQTGVHPGSHSYQVTPNVIQSLIALPLSCFSPERESVCS
jgi:hypothetical protein